ncbi:MAG: hypothetical protein K2Q09_08210, partial [Phycisphaerales bacterium]|nr:hypothetical protein [Phycisphaerales bacterium]
AAVVTERSADATVLNLSVELPIAEDSDVGVIELHPAGRDRPVRVPYSVTRTNRLTWAAEPLAVAIPGGAGAALLKEEPVTDSSGLVTPLASLSVMLDGPAKGITSELQPLGGGQWRVTARANGSPASAPSGAGWLTIQNQAGVTLARLPWTWVPSAR